MSEAQQKATKSWQQRHNLKRVELLVPGDTLTAIDTEAAEQGLSRAKWIMVAVEHTLGTEKPPAVEDRLSSIEAKLDSLLASVAAPASMTAQIPEDTKPKAKHGATSETPLHRNALSDRDARILELAGLSEIKVAEILRGEGIKCSPRTVGNVRKRFSEGKL